MSLISITTPHIRDANDVLQSLKTPQTTTTMVTPPMLELLDFPDEIQLLVLSSLDVTSLRSVTLVCKHLRGLAEQYLYSNITVLHGEQASDLSYSLTNNRRRPGWIKSFLVSTKFGEDSGLSDMPPQIRSMTNLRHLRLETPDCNVKRPIDRISWIKLQDRYERIFEASSILVPNPTQRLLPNLQSCTLHFVDSSTALYPLSKYASIFLHPTLRSLTISCTCTDEPERLLIPTHDDPSLRKSTALEFLHLEECDISAESLELLLSFPRALKSLKISEGTRYDSMFRTASSRRHGNIKPLALAEALEKTCKDSLETLSLALGYRRDRGTTINQAGQALRLTEFEKLTTLEVNNRTLDLIKSDSECDHLTYRRLPPNLETLKVFSLSMLALRYLESPRPIFPFGSCLVRDKARHGVAKLKNVVYSFEYHDESDDFLQDSINEFFIDLGDNVLRGPPRHPDGQAWGQPNVAAGILPAPRPNPAAAPVTNPTVDMLLEANGQLNGTFLAGLQGRYQPLRPGQHHHQRSIFRTNPVATAHLKTLDHNKLSLIQLCQTDQMPHYRQTNTTLQIDMVQLPRGFIPPYLYPENQPIETTNWWNSDQNRPLKEYLDELKRMRHEEQIELDRRMSQRQTGTNLWDTDDDDDDDDYNGNEDEDVEMDDEEDEEDEDNMDVDDDDDDDDNDSDNDSNRPNRTFYIDSNGVDSNSALHLSSNLG